MSRDINTVITQMLEKVPGRRENLIMGLKSVQRKAPYCPPESSGNLWWHCAVILNDEIGLPVCDWEIAVMEIFSGEPNAEVDTPAQVAK